MADGYLSTEQVLLLENLMYMGADDSPLPKIKDCEGKSIESILSMVDINSIPDDASCGSYMTGKDWKDLVNAIKNDPELCKMTVAATHVDHSDGGGGGVSAVFTNPDTKEAVVAFRGTAQNETISSVEPRQIPRSSKTHWTGIRRCMRSWDSMTAMSP